ncbi:Maf family protein [Robertmurraya korlensis]|uniref:Maf family protein n=1 Tax=Robertmurraya korlensis TaxID=519977 RepID=UPI00203FEA4D|nr:Maf family protein [Robertmurraya korlensis]MCM3599353.1 Maf family protein [Robertmurraya korlensis]
MQNLILASSSPRRKELLSILQIPFEVKASDVDETFHSELAPHEVVIHLAERKAKHVSKNDFSSIVIGADTIVVAAGEILGKPNNPTEAFAMLRKLSGLTHSVYTGVAIVSAARTTTFFEKTDVTFWELTDEEIHSYISTGEPFDKAGSYGIQGFGSTLVKRISGDYFTVVGLPIARLVRELQPFR